VLRSKFCFNIRHFVQNEQALCHKVLSQFCHSEYMGSMLTKQETACTGQTKPFASAMRPNPEVF